MRQAMFIFSPLEQIYLPANKNAIAVCSIFSRRSLRKGDMLFVRNHGYEPILTNGEPIEVINIIA